MLFNSIDFAIYLPIVFLVYWFIFKNSLKSQNAFLLIASYIFYGWWDWRFLSLIIFSSSVDYLVGRGLTKTETASKRRLLLLVSIVVNLGFLGFFKYYNFFAENFSAAFTFFGQSFDPERLNIILPVGISFYTFQTLSYSIDVFNKKIKPTNNIIAFFAFVSFFPQLVAGPIERASNLLPQFYKNRVFSYLKASDGMRQILWGLFKKVVIADNCATYVNQIFENYTQYSGITLLFGAFLFAFQIYGDFSGYSDIAIGTARLFGFNLMRNFAYPYFSRDIAEFWRRWHISLSTWFRDYVYIPLGGSKGGLWFKIRNTLIIFVISGFWHGANWTFVVWGILNALYFLPLLISGRNRTNTNTVAEGKQLPNFKEFLQITATFMLTCLAWIFFRSASVVDSFQYIQKIFTRDFFIFPTFIPISIGWLIGLQIVIEWIQREKEHALEFNDQKIKKPMRWCIYITILALIYFFEGAQQQFIYFQF